MSQSKLSLDFKGLVTAPGQLAAPNGSVTESVNINYPAPGLAEKRRGIDARAYGFGGGCWKMLSTKQLGNNILANTGTGTAAANLLYGDGTAAFSTLSTPDSSDFSNTPEWRMRAAVSLKSHFLTSSRAAGRLDSDYSLSFAGMPRVPSCYGAPVVAPVAGGLLAANEGVAYRCVWVLVDADGVERVSAPSGRFVVQNIAGTAGYTGGAANPVLKAWCPLKTECTATPITTSWILRLYRSFTFSTGSGQANDEMQLCFQRNVTGGEIAFGYVSITDTCPDDALGAYLYTNTVAGGDVLTGTVRAGSTALGILSANDRPPLAKDVAVFANCAWWANFTTPQRIQFSILAVGAAGSVLKAADVLTIAGTNFTGVAGAPAGTNEFTVQTGLGSTAENLRATAVSLVGAINANSFNTLVSATYLGSDTSPGTIGTILVEARRSDAASFTISTSGSSVPFLPQMTLTSTRDTWGNGLAISKPFQADAVPPANYVRVGRNDTVIQCVIPLRDALFIFTDDGIFWARGNTPADFVIDEFDTTFRILGRETAVTVGDAIYAWGREGIARITNGGVEFIDLPIRNYALQLAQQVGLTTFAADAFSVGYRVARRVCFFFRNGDETQTHGCRLALTYDISTGAWSTYDFLKDNAKNAGCVRFADEIMHLGEWANGTDTYVYFERDTAGGAAADFKDSLASGSTTPVASRLTWTSSAPNPAGLCHWQEAQLYWSDSDIRPATYTFPTSVEFTMTSEHGGTMSGTVTSPTTVQSRIMVSPAVGLASRQVVGIIHSTMEYLGLSGFALLYVPVSNFTSR